MTSTAAPTTTPGPQPPLKPKDMTKAERRALQEKQRAEKEARKAAGATSAPPKPLTSSSGPSTGRKGRSDSIVSGPFSTSASVIMSTTEGGKASRKDRGHVRSVSTSAGPDRLEPTSLFHHLELARGATRAAAKDIHPAILRLGLLYRELAIAGSNARCIALVRALARVIQDYHPPPKTTMSRHLLGHISPQIGYLVGMRPMSVGMGNAVRYLKYEISHLPPEWSDDRAKEYLVGRLDDFIRERIERADEEMMEAVLERFFAPRKDHPEEEVVVVTFGRSSVVERALLMAHEQQRVFRVVVVDSRPMEEGKNLYTKLDQHGIPCIYTHLHGLDVILRDASVVLVGAHAVLGNGAVLSRVGTAGVAVMARAHHVPFCVMCETYKFTERVQLDAFVWNEIGRPGAIVQVGQEGEKGVLQNHDEMERLKVLNLMYDVTPAEYVSVVVTDVGPIPCSSVPVVLREYRPMLQ